MNTSISGLLKVFLDHRVRLLNWAYVEQIVVGKMPFVLSLEGLRGVNQTK